MMTIRGNMYLRGTTMNKMMITKMIATIMPMDMSLKSDIFH